MPAWRACVKVLIIGGGDGGIARELDRYTAVKEVVLCEIDEVASLNLSYIVYHLSSWDSKRGASPAVLERGKSYLSGTSTFVWHYNDSIVM